MTFSHQTEQWLPHRVEDVFAFFANPENLLRLMPAWQRARIERASLVPPPEALRDKSRSPVAGRGSRIMLSFRPVPYCPLRVQWEAEITEFVWNEHFCDRQVRGPFAFWQHFHRFRAIDRQAIDVTVITDHLEYEPPMGSLGKIVHKALLERQIKRQFAFRQSQIARIFGTPPKESFRAPRTRSDVA